MLEAIAVLAAAIWIVTAVLKRIPALKPVDSAVIALCVALVAVIASILTGYLVGNPVEIAAQVLIALYAAGLTQDKVATPVKTLFK